MKIFESNIEEDFELFYKTIDNIYNELAFFEIEEIFTLKKIKSLFKQKIDDFLKTDRKLNIGIIGQVKSGRSTFLNTLLFDGETILPKAVTPKTITVTKILYSKENFIEIEFYSSKEWDIILQQNNVDKLGDKYNNIGSDNKIIYYDDLQVLDDYISENGKYSATVKNVTLNIKKTGMKNLCIVDTPGLNDPIISRTKATKDFLEICDVVFFLSHSSQFLDDDDLRLLTQTLPDKGVKKLILICSRFDDGLNDTLQDYINLEYAYEKTKNRLTNNAKKIFTNLISQNDSNNQYKNILKNISQPVFISSMAHNMSKKNIEQFSENEKIVFNNLNYFKKLNNENLIKIGNFSEIKNIFKNISRQKEKTLIKKSESFVPDTKIKIKSVLLNAKYKYEKRINLLMYNDKTKLEMQKLNMLKKTEILKQSIDTLFYELVKEIEYSKILAVKNINNNKEHAITLEEKTSIEVVNESMLKKDTKWYNPLTWSKKSDEEFSFEEKHTYIETKQALEQIKNYAMLYKHDATDSIDNIIEKEQLRTMLLQLVIESLDTSDRNHDPLFYKFMVTNTLDNIEIPKVDMDISSILKIISDKFSGEVKNTSDKESLKILLEYCINSFYEQATIKYDTAMEQFKSQLTDIKTIFYNTLCENIKNEYDAILFAFENREHEIEIYSNIINKLDYAMTLL